MIKTINLQATGTCEAGEWEDFTFVKSEYYSGSFVAATLLLSGTNTCYGVINQNTASQLVVRVRNVATSGTANVAIILQVAYRPYD